MSEIKGQLLGVIIVLLIFGTIVGVLVPVFQKLAQKAKNEVTDITELTDSEVENAFEGFEDYHGTLMHY
ncbi:MAG: hypothetical protein MJ227_03285 [Bacilli bacterium]|nr:hypothetical protein [Bacilli bacterium]